MNIKVTTSLFIGLLFAISSCNSNKQKTTSYFSCIDSVFVDDDLKHTQYWSKHDQWDLESVTLSIRTCESENVNHISLIDYCDYKCSPASPDKEVDELLIYDISFKNGNETIFVESKTFKVNIIDYPYNYSTSDMVAVVAAVLSIVLVPTIIYLILLLTKKTKY